MCDMTHSYVRHDSFICATWLIHMCDMTHSFVMREWMTCWFSSFLLIPLVDSLIRMSHFTHMTDNSYLSCLEASWAVLLMFVASTPSCANSDSLICVAWLTHIYATHHLYATLARHATCITQSCHAYTYIAPHMWTSHGTHSNESRHVMRITESCHAYECVMSHMWTSHGTHINESCDAYKWVMSHVWLWHVSHANDSHERVTSHLQGAHVIYVKEAYNTKQATSHI